MRIFLVISPSGNSSVPGSMTWYRNFYEPLLDLGHDVYLLRKDLAAKELNEKYGTLKFKEKFSQKLIDVFNFEHKRKPFDLFFSYLKNSDIETSCINEIKNNYVTTVNFSCNNTHQFYLVEEISPNFEYNLHSEKDAAEKFRLIGANAIWFPMAANPTYYHPTQTQKQFDASFVGSNYAKRFSYIRHLLENQIDVHCFGPNWLINKPYPTIKRIYKELNRSLNLTKSLLSFSTETRLNYSSKVRDFDFQVYLRTRYRNNLHYPVSDDDMITIYSQSKINLGFLEVYSVDNDSSKTLSQHMHLREFEIPMSGGLYFTNYSDELSEFYVPDEEVIVFRNEHELLDKVQYYLSNETQANIVCKAGLERALKCHTYQNRFKKLFEQLGLQT
jgi:spore maturation protein CgeB